MPNEPKRLVNTTTSSIRVTLFFQNPLIVNTSSESVSKSAIVGLRTNACTKPDTHPEAKIG